VKPRQLQDRSFIRSKSAAYRVPSCGLPKALVDAPGSLPSYPAHDREVLTSTPEPSLVLVLQPEAMNAAGSSDGPFRIPGVLFAERLWIN
jgi:hypothetical protein